MAFDIKNYLRQQFSHFETGDVFPKSRIADIVKTNLIWIAIFIGLTTFASNPEFKGWIDKGYIDKALQQAIGAELFNIVGVLAFFFMSVSITCSNNCILKITQALLQATINLGAIGTTILYTKFVLSYESINLLWRLSDILAFILVHIFLLGLIFIIAFIVYLAILFQYNSNFVNKLSLIPYWLKLSGSSFSLAVLAFSLWLG